MVSGQVRLYLDEDVLPLVSRLLVPEGYDVVRGRSGLDDEDHLQRASGDGRIILTHNAKDFVRLGKEWSVEGRHHSGILICPRQFRRQQVAELARRIQTALEAAGSENLVDRIVWI